tara:strand:- start:432 stop:641 length:210 start_codon:yes stop_codon:yes gene_type:complete
MIKEIVLIVLLFNGEMSLPSFPFKGTVYECIAYGNQLQVELAKHSWNDPRGQAWYLKDGTGTWQGFICQ